MDRRSSLAQALGIPAASIRSVDTVSGGDTSAAWRVTTGDDRLFVKSNAAAFAPVLAAEADALGKIAAAGVIRVPEVIRFGHDEQRCWLVLEWLDLAPGDAFGAQNLGHALAALHLVSAPTHGWHADNFIGRSPQSNRASSDWSLFFAEQRLATQAALLRSAACGEALLPKLEQLMAALGQRLAGHTPAASLLHGDLWSGNWAMLRDGTPVIFDPAAYYGDRETDIAMTELFGRFPQSFYDAYNEVLPLPDGYQQRREIYQLYHVLNHALLFGNGYVRQAENMMSRLLET